MHISVKKWLLFSIGILILSCGIALMIWAQAVGVSPWDSFHLGLMNILPLNFGQTIQLVGAIAVLIGFALGVKPKLGTILNMVIIGWIVNVLLAIFPSNQGDGLEPMTLVIFLIGIMLTGIGTGMYITADAGIGPRDSIMVGLNRRFGIRIGVARTSMEILVVILAFFLAGPIGIGTIIFSVTIGFFVEKTLSVMRRYTENHALTEEK